MSDDKQAPPDGSSGSGSGDPPRPPRRARTAPGGGPGGGWFGWFRRFAKLWGFLLFVVLVLVLFRHVILPFVFAALLAYILAPLITRMSQRADGSRRMPRGVAIIACYLVLLAAIALFVVLMLPRISQDFARLGREAPGFYKKINDEYAPRTARWLERKFPSLAPAAPEEEERPVVADVPLPPGTQFVVTPLPDGRFAIELEPSGISVQKTPAGGWVIAPRDEPPAPASTEDKLRAFAGRVLVGLQAQLDDFFRIGRRIVVGTIAFVFKFFLALMIAAFILLDIPRFLSFARGLVPGEFWGDFDAIAAGVDRALSGVIRGQLIICLLNGVLTYAGLLIFDVKYSLMLAVVATLLSLIPIFGTILSTIPIVLAALVSGDTGVDVTRGVLILAWIIGIHFLEANLFNPKIMGEAAKIHPVMVVFALLAGEQTYGLVGALLGVPVAAIIQVLFVYFRSKAWRAQAAA